MPGLLANSNSQPTAHEAVLTSKDMIDLTMSGLDMLVLKHVDDDDIQTIAIIRQAQLFQDTTCVRLRFTNRTLYYDAFG
ncbi:MAG: hypothetical protein V4495_18600, partial [Pseudomonadota bacterium]